MLNLRTSDALLMVKPFYSFSEKQQSTWNNVKDGLCFFKSVTFLNPIKTPDSLYVTMAADGLAVSACDVI